MLLLVGLGNPGDKYASNRHNIGFMAVDVVHTRWRFPPWRKNFQALVAEGTIDGERVLLMKPQTYMNESGRAVGEAVRFLKLTPADVVVIHDELDLPAGKLRMKVGGGHGGHNGLRSITAQITDAYRRMRLGIGHPGHKELVHGHVLSDFHKVDRDWLVALLDAVADNAGELTRGADTTFANRVHLAIDPKPDKVVKAAEDEAVKAATQPAEPVKPPERNAMAAILKSLMAQRGRR
jgi:PTH1 family peptidyl-tRNA hydrolase